MEFDEYLPSAFSPAQPPHRTPKAVLGRNIQDHPAEHLRALLKPPDGRLPPRLKRLTRRLQEILDAQERPSRAVVQGRTLSVPSQFARLCYLAHGDPDRADDLVQDTVVRALANRSSFREGRNLQAWLFTILRNGFYTQLRKNAREIEDADGTYASRLCTPPDQLDRLHVQELCAALEHLSIEHREVLLLVGAEGISYEDAALICGCAVGTIKSRVNRARQRLAELLGYTDGDLTTTRSCKPP